MRASGRLIPLLAAGALLAACGGGTSGPVTTGAEPAPPPTGGNTVTISPFGTSGADDGATTAAAAEPIFPAESPSGVLDLAAQHPDGRVTYAIVQDGSPGELTIARLGGSAMVALTTAAGTTRVGVDVEGPAITWVCTSQAGEDPACATEDPDGAGARALAAAAALVGEERVRELVAAASAASDANVAVRTQADGVDASCVTGSGAGGSTVVCVSPSGFVTDAEGGGLIARAVSVSPDVAPADVEPPAPPS